MNRVDQYLADKLNQRRLDGNLRQLTTHKARVDLFSNDYLGLATNNILAEVHSSASLPFYNYTGSTGSRLLSGNTAQVEALEHTIATFHDAEAALVFNSGYDANTGLLASIASRDTVILSDELCHASLIDGIRLSQCTRKYKFAHNDMDDLEEKLQKYSAAHPVIVVAESIYSMDGDMAPLQVMAQLCEEHNARLIVDEAHATGVAGTHGEGLVYALGLQQQVFARIHTFGKAMGCHGAAVAGSELLKQYLVNFARSFIYTTALPGHTISCVQNAYSYLADINFTNQPLHELITYFRQQIQATGGNGWKDSYSPIQALIAGSNALAKKYATALQGVGLQVKPILHPTVPQGMERLRICLHTFNTRTEIDTLFAILNTTGLQK